MHRFLLFSISFLCVWSNLECCDSESYSLLLSWRLYSSLHFKYKFLFLAFDPLHAASSSRVVDLLTLGDEPSPCEPSLGDVVPLIDLSSEPPKKKKKEYEVN